MHVHLLVLDEFSLLVVIVHLHIICYRLVFIVSYMHECS
jgi:hypothetical protein